jgi:hypothetical protein
MTWKQIFRFFCGLFYYFSAGNHPYISDPFVEGPWKKDEGDEFSENNEEE